jgi:hypothetical protein
MVDHDSTVEYKGYKLPAHLARDLELFEFMLEDSKITRAQIEAAMSATERAKREGPTGIGYTYT